VKRIFTADQFVHLTEIKLGDPQEQAEQIADRCEEILEELGFKKFLDEFTHEFDDHKANVHRASYRQWRRNG
jgi:hypothetical protein